MFYNYSEIIGGGQAARLQRILKGDENMNEYDMSILDRIYQSYVCGGDSLTFRLRKDPKADRTISALERLEGEGYIRIVSKTEANIRAAVTDKGIAYGNSAV